MVTAVVSSAVKDLDLAFIVTAPMSVWPSIDTRPDLAPQRSAGIGTVEENALLDAKAVRIQADRGFMSARIVTVPARKVKGFAAAASVERKRAVEHSMLLETFWCGFKTTCHDPHLKNLCGNIIGLSTGFIFFHRETNRLVLKN